MNEIKIGKRSIPMYYSTFEMIAIQEEIGCTAFQLKEQVFGIRQVDEDDPMSIVMDCVTEPEKTKKLATLIRILGNAGLEEDGQEPNLTDKWILRNMRPSMVMAYAIAAMAVITEGNKVEVPEDDKQTGPVDEGLEEENAKKQPGN